MCGTRCGVLEYTASSDAEWLTLSGATDGTSSFDPLESKAIAVSFGNEKLARGVYHGSILLRAAMRRRAEDDSGDPGSVHV